MMVTAPNEQPSLERDRLLSTPEDIEAALLAALRSRVRKRYSQVRLAPIRSSAVDDIADRMIDTMPDPAVAALDTAVGPFYDTAGLTKWLRISRQAIHKQIGKRFLGVQKDDGDWLFPAFQFASDGTVIAHLMDVAHLLDTGLHSSWPVALWLNTPVDELADRSIVDLLKHGETETAIEFARTEVARLSA
jgi:hypothetical protein